MTTIDSLQVVQEFVSNAKATLDSLNRFEFTKARYSNLLNQYALEKQVQLALLVRKEELERQNKQLQTDLTKTQFERDDYRKKKNWKGLENWIWRAAAAALIYSQIHK